MGNKSLTVQTIDKRQRIPERVILELVHQIAEQFMPYQIILFGSYADGRPKPESDVDLLVIMQTDQRESAQALNIRQALNPLFGVDILVYTPENLETRLALGDSFLKEVMERGKTLYESSNA